jgi:hypothetical protein
MARKRMFSLLVVDTDEFLDMPSSTQSLYYHLGMRADDDGFVASPKKIVKLVNCSNDDLKLLIAKGFIIPFDSGIIAIRHWKLNNDLKKDRYTPTIYLNEKSTLKVNKNKVYSIDGNNLETNWRQNGNKLETQYSIDKNSIDKNSIDKNSKEYIEQKQEENQEQIQEQKQVKKEKVKKEKKPKETHNSIIENYTINEDLREALKSFVEMRKELKKPITIKGLKIALGKLDKMALDDLTKIDIVNQSIEGSWSGLFPLRNNNQYNQEQKKKSRIEKLLF